MKKNNSLHLPSRISKRVQVICDNIENNKAVYTVLITLGVHKLLYPTQDIRYHQVNLKNGFSARSIDTHFITPTLKKAGLTSMAESGWLTRSMEQPFPYDKKYKGKISRVKDEFLYIVNIFEKETQYIEPILLRILQEAIVIKESMKSIARKLDNSSLLPTQRVIEMLEKFLEYDFKGAGKSKLLVIMLYSVYEILLNEVSLYSNKILSPLNRHTASDRHSGTSGDIEILDGKSVFESIEVKYNIEVSSHVLNVAVEKIRRSYIKRYLILSTKGVKDEDVQEITDMIRVIRLNYGCIVIVNGVLETIKYYLRLIKDVHVYVNFISKNIADDLDLKIEHKKVWVSLVDQLYKEGYDQLSTEINS